MKIINLRRDGTVIEDLSKIKFGPKLQKEINCLFERALLRKERGFESG